MAFYDLLDILRHPCSSLLLFRLMLEILIISHIEVGMHLLPLLSMGSDNDFILVAGLFVNRLTDNVAEEAVALPPLLFFNVKFVLHRL